MKDKLFQCHYMVHSFSYFFRRFTNSVLKGLNGEENIIECAYVQSEVTEAAFFATPILLVKNFLSMYGFEKSKNM